MTSSSEGQVGDSHEPTAASRATAPRDQVRAPPADRRARPDGGLRYHFFGGLFSALFLALGLPPSGHRLVTWFALIPLIFSLNRQRKNLKLRLAHGLTFGLVLVLWYYLPAVRSEGLGTGGSWRAAGSSLAALSGWLVFAGLAGPILCLRSEFLVALGLPALWASIEFLRLEFLPVSPPQALALSIDPEKPEAQVVRFIGVVGLGFLIVLLNSLLFLTLRARDWGRQLALVLAAMLVLVIPLVDGALREPDLSGRVNLRLGLVQLATSEAADPLRLAESLAGATPQLTVFPPRSFELGASVEGGEAFSLERFERYARAKGSDLIVGFENPGGDAELAFIDRDHGVIARRLERAGPLGQPTLIPGAAGKLGFLGEDDLARSGPARRVTRAGAGVLLASTDREASTAALDAWWSRACAYRALENDRWLVRSDRGGRSAIYAPDGSVGLQASPGVDWATSENLSVREAVGFYPRFGWLLGPLSWAIVLTLLAVSRRQTAGVAPTPDPAAAKLL